MNETNYLTTMPFIYIYGKQSVLDIETGTVCDKYIGAIKNIDNINIQYEEMTLATNEKYEVQRYD